MILIIASISILSTANGLTNTFHRRSNRILQGNNSPTSAPTILEDGGFTQEPSLDNAPTGAPTILEGDEFLGEVGGLSTNAPSKQQLPSNSIPSTETPSSSIDTSGSQNTTTPTSTTTTTSSTSPSLSTGAIVGIALGVGVLVGILLTVLFFSCRSRFEKGAPSVVMVQKTHSNKINSSSAKDSKASSKTADEDLECPDFTEYSCTASSSRGVDLPQHATHVSVRDPRYTPYALKILEEEDAEEHILVDV